MNLKKDLNIRRLFLLACMVLLLSACVAPGSDITSQAGSPQPAVLTDKVDEPESIVEVVFTPTPLSTPTDVPTQTPTPEPEPTQTPTPEATPIPPEVPFRVEDGIVQKWTVNPVTNQEEWVPDESFPVLEPEPGRRTPVIESIGSVTYQINGEEVGYFSAISAIYGKTEAIFINGEWTLASEINVKDFIAPVAPGEVEFANENWSDGRKLIESGSVEFLEKFQQALIDGNPAYFRWYVGSADIFLNNVLAVASTRNYMLPVPPDGVPKLLLPSWDKTRYSTEFAIRTRNPHTEINTDINFGGLTVLIFTPDQIKNDPVLKVIVNGLPMNYLLSVQSSERGQYGIVVLPDGSLLWVHGEQMGQPNQPKDFKTTLLGERPENFSGITRAFAAAYLEAMTRAEGESVRVFPLNPFDYGDPEMISGDGVGLQPFVE